MLPKTNIYRCYNFTQTSLPGHLNQNRELDNLVMPGDGRDS